MKKETKELIKWIKEACEAFVYQSKGFKENLSRDKTCDEAIKFLESLPEIESHLCRGGYIQDKNGTPCCHGDNVRFVVAEATDDEWCLGRLIWEPKLSAFQIVSNAFTCFVSNIKWFEKVYEK